ncbi:hypothetical protein GUITHDRAFT_120629 [Guillardia theta CCMP2712]|uniref:Ubiquitin-like domain-containing protein n=2 Tax=Guillardia theta TaxID=55529 RepID=L1IAQ6_GUITC|nr:hypothetical protein GUITHDRAFT_120629 [Guillardia theta CCMP2712]EKX33187.1 hypothetical protein GUITHDRAFT_120629 [Guillardia theta CCMP2712]|eukprot:XP_005820167.1 hypothetical protein GUITHDRAFT_120629 [Guillardia theta CCMP2712]
MERGLAAEDTQNGNQEGRGSNSRNRGSRQEQRSFGDTLRKEQKQGPGNPGKKGGGRTGMNGKERADMLKLAVKIVSEDRSVSVEVPSSASAVDLKRKVGQQLQHAIGEEEAERSLRLIFSGKELDGERALKEFNLASGSVVHVVIVRSQLGVSSPPVSDGPPPVQGVAEEEGAGEGKEEGRKEEERKEEERREEPCTTSRIPCDALCYAEKKWRRGFRTKKTEKGYMVQFSEGEDGEVQDTQGKHIRLRAYWWRNLKDEEDVISLEPLKKLKYEPFELPSSSEKIYWFDGRVLANYLVSSANFVHPVSRRPLERKEVVELDAYLERNKCGKACVTHVYDQKDSSSENAQNHLRGRAEEAG